MRILHFAEILTGGIATYVNNLTPSQVADHGPDAVWVAAPAGQMHLIETKGVNLLPLEYSGQRSPDRLYRLRRQFHAAFRDRGPFDVLHLHSTYAGLIGRSVPIPSRTRVVYCPNGWAFTIRTAGWKRHLFALVERGLARRLDAYVAVSQSELDAAIEAGLPRDKGFLIHSGIDVRPPSAGEAVPSNGPIRLLFVGRFDRQKGFDLLLEALGRLDPALVRLTVIGGNVVDAPREFRFPPGVELRGWQPPGAVHAAMREHDAVVMPSRWEAFGFVATEAMREERAMIAARVGGLAEIVVDGETGVHFEADSAAALAEAIARASRLDLRQLGRAGRARFEALFTSGRMAEQHRVLYARLRSER